MHKNSKKQGDACLGGAIAYFTHKGYGVSIPLTDSQDYDLIVDIDDTLNRVQVKTTYFARPNSKGQLEYYVSLSTKGGNKSRQTIKYFDPNRVEILYIVTHGGDHYCIPMKDGFSAKSTLRLSSKYDRYKVHPAGIEPASPEGS